MLSPFLSVEEAYLLAKLLRSIDPQAVLAMGPVPMAGEDQKFPGGFAISAEKAPNRRGVEEVLAYFMHKVLSLEDFLKEIGRNELGGVWVSGGYKGPWIEEPVAQRFEKVPLLIVQDLFPSPLSARATYELPAATFAERDGSYMNRSERLQTSNLAVRPPWGVRAEGLFVLADARPQLRGAFTIPVPCWMICVARCCSLPQPAAPCQKPAWT